CLLMVRLAPRSSLFSLHDALPILLAVEGPPMVTLPWVAASVYSRSPPNCWLGYRSRVTAPPDRSSISSLNFRKDSFSEVFSAARSEEHTSELQSRFDLVCRLRLEK